MNEEKIRSKMPELQVNGKTVGIGMEISSLGVSTAIFCDDTNFQPLVYSELPIVYKSGGANVSIKPVSLSDWLSPIKIPVTGNDQNRNEIFTSKVLVNIIHSVLSRVQQHIGAKVDFVCVSVAPSLSERERSRTYSIIKEFDCSVQLLNEDRALLKASKRFQQATSLLIYNLHSRMVEISFYQSSGGTLNLECLEVLENCGYNDFGASIFAALFDGRLPPAWTVNQHHYVMKVIRSALATWQTGENLILPSDVRVGGTKASLPAQRVADIFSTTLASSFGTARRMISDSGPVPITVFLSHPPHLPYVLVCLQQAIGGKILTMDRTKILEGVSRHAWESNGKKTIYGLNSRKLPERIKFHMQRQANDKEPQGQSANPLERLSHLSGNDTAQPNLIDITKGFLDKIFQALEPMSDGQIQSLIPAITLQFEEFQARALDKAAKKLISRHQFDEALQIYKKYYRKNNGFRILLAPAVGLCIAQAKNALKRGRESKLKHWTRQGLKIDNGHQELLQLKQMWKPKKR